MLWRKAWLETRWRFISALVILTLLAGSNVFEYLATARLIAGLDTTSIPSNGSGMLGAVIRDAIEMQKDFRGFIWYSTFRDNLTGGGILFAILLGCGGLLSEASKGSALFTLALPVTRRRLFGVRTFTGLAQCFVMAIVPPLTIPLLAPAINQRFAVVDTLAHGFCLFVVASLFFALASYLSTLFADIWRPLMISAGIACMLAVASFALPPLDIFSVMNGASYFRSGSLPWTGLLTSAVLAMALLYSAAETLERQDF
jgi:ABC-2 type transport system permease protein